MLYEPLEGVRFSRWRRAPHAPRASFGREALLDFSDPGQLF
jgi:hypothetical protein